MSTHSPQLAQGRSGRVISGGSRHPGTEWFDQHMDNLPVGEWSASDGKRLVAHGPTIEDLYEQLDRAKIPVPDVAIRYCSKEATA
jgi:hypothetical protein